MDDVAFDKSKTYYENNSPKNWKHSSESMKLIPAVHAKKIAKLENFDSRALSRFERYLVIELF